MNLSWMYAMFYLLISVACLPVFLLTFLAVRKNLKLRIRNKLLWRMILASWLFALACLHLVTYILNNILDVSQAGPAAIIWLIGGPLVCFLPPFWLGVTIVLARQQSISTARSLVAASYATLLSLLIMFGGTFAGYVVKSQFDRQQEYRQLIQQNPPPNVFLENFGVVLPFGFRYAALADQRGRPGRMEYLSNAWEYNPDFFTQLEHEQADGYSIPSAFDGITWSELVEQAARELADGLASAGCEVYLGRGRTEQINLNDEWQNYDEPVIVGRGSDYLVHLVIVPSPRLFGSAPVIRVSVYTEDPAGVFLNSQASNHLQPWDPNSTDPLFTVRPGDKVAAQVEDGQLAAHDGKPSE